MIGKWLNILILRYRQSKIRRQLKWQEFLTRHGIGFRTEVLEIIKEGQPVQDYTRCRIRTRLRVKGRIVYRQVYTLLKGEQPLQKGDPVLIRYRPGNLSQVLVMTA